MKRLSLCYRHPQEFILYSLSPNCQEQKTHPALTKKKRFDRISLIFIEFFNTDSLNDALLLSCPYEMLRIFEITS